MHQLLSISATLLAISLTCATASNLLESSVDPGQPNNNASPPELQREDPLVREKRYKCVPMLDLASYLLPSNSSPGPAADGQNQAGHRARALSSLNFAVADINMPITQADSSLGSAMRLISSLGSQFEPPLGSDRADEENEDDAGEAYDDPADANMVKFRDNRLLAEGLNLSMLDIHLYTDGEPKFGIGVTIKNTTLVGRFSYSGPLAIGTSRLAGFYRMSIDSIYLVASSNLTKSELAGQADDRSLTRTPKASQYVLRTNEFRMNITNLGYITINLYDTKESPDKPASSYLLRLLQRLLQRTVKRTYYSFEGFIREALERESRRSLDCELTRFGPLQADTDGSILAAGSIDSYKQADLARILSGEVVKSKLGSVSLPNFEHQQNILGTSARVEFSNGSISGLDNIRLPGETRVKLHDQHLFVNTSIGWSDLRPRYNWSLTLGNGKSPSSRGFVSFAIKNIEFDAVITKGILPPSRLTVEQLTIRRLDSPKMDIGGLPGLNRVTRGIVNFFMGRLKQRIAGSIQPELRQQLERSLNRLGAGGSGARAGQ